MSDLTENDLKEVHEALTLREVALRKEIERLKMKEEWQRMRIQKLEKDIRELDRD